MTSISNSNSSLSVDYSLDSREGSELNKQSKLINILDVSQLKNLKMYFFYNDHKEHSLKKEEFVESICSITGNNLYIKEAEDFFEQVCVEDFNTKEDIIFWKQVLNEIRYNTTFFQDAWITTPFDQNNITMHLMSHCKHESIVKVISIETEEFFCYTVLSRLGQVGIYDGHLNLLREYVLQLSQCPDDLVRTARRRHNIWINDSVYMPDAQFITIAVSDGSIHFIDTVCLVHVPTFCITGLKTTPTCLEYCPGSISLLFIGDDKGSIGHIEFLQPKRSLFKRDPTNKVDTYLWKELESQQEWVKIHTFGVPIHPDSIKYITYCQSDEATISCCQNYKKSLVIKHLRDEWEPYIFHIQHGIHCFHYNETLKLLVTGCACIVYIWNPLVTKMYLAKLEGHKKSIVDVRIYENFNLVISISKDEVLMVWSLNTYVCLQTIQFDFPVYNVLGKVVEFTTQTFYPGPVIKKPPEEQKASLKSIDASNITSLPTSIYMPKENWESEILLIVCSNYISTIKQNLKDYSQNHSPLPPPVEDKKPALPLEWSFSNTDRITIDETDSTLIESPKVDDEEIEYVFIESRPPLDHEAFNIDTLKKPTNTKIKSYVDEMVKNGTPYLAMCLSPVYKLEISKNLMLSETTKSKFPFLEKIDEIFCDGISYDERKKSVVKEKNKGKSINITKLMKIIDQLELNEDDDIASILNKYI
ncbi:WD40/YVTN repeat-like-containing domain,WD40 repeat,WD40-repeat-containing domain [Cinara cedri]|uniref:WD40/YVTN repeat-like-containing domain,WD40 repeat,WD40-repeat-containing domain n=1 Tax=Cinara cedri TaxID=506608 RepID=A0A5E4N1Z4_9HEMI|nr:WD40/YVTN repeat-like-containing domain,WD40 repeat,WD40-repeat-containing domain [Cinara cedri]